MLNGCSYLWNCFECLSKLFNLPKCSFPRTTLGVVYDYFSIKTCKIIIDLKKFPSNLTSLTIYLRLSIFIIILGSTNMPRSHGQLMRLTK